MPEHLEAVDAGHAPVQHHGVVPVPLGEERQGRLTVTGGGELVAGPCFLILGGRSYLVTKTPRPARAALPSSSKSRVTETTLEG